jgi:hypothetical protein
MRAALVVALLLVTACETRAPQLLRAPPASAPTQVAPMPQTGDVPAPGWIQHHPATGHLVV